MRIFSIFFTLFILFYESARADNSYYSEKDFTLIKKYDISSDGAIMPWNKFIFCGEGDIFLSTSSEVIHNKITDKSIYQDKNVNVKDLGKIKVPKPVSVYKCLSHVNDHLYLYGRVDNVFGILDIGKRRVDFHRSFIYWPNSASNYKPYIVCEDALCKSNIEKKKFTEYHLIVDKKLFDFSSEELIEYEPFYNNSIALRKKSLDFNKDLFCLEYREIRNWASKPVSTCPQRIAELYNADYIYIDGHIQLYHSLVGPNYTECYYLKDCVERKYKSEEYIPVEKYIAFGKEYYKKRDLGSDFLIGQIEICSLIELADQKCLRFGFENEILYSFDYQGDTYVITADEMIEFGWYSGKFSLWRKKK